jgi:hypothetical protein
MTWCGFTVIEVRPFDYQAYYDMYIRCVEDIITLSSKYYLSETITLNEYYKGVTGFQKIMTDINNRLDEHNYPILHRIITSNREGNC